MKLKITNNTTRSWNIVAGWSKYVLKIKVVFTPSSYNVSASCSIIYNQTVCPFQYIQKLQAFDSSLFIGQSYFNIDEAQLYLILQPLYYT